MQQTDLLVLDCDGVLIDSEILVCRIAAEELTRLGYPISTDEVVRRFAGRPDREMRAEIGEDWGKPVAAEYESCVNARTEKAYASQLEIMPGVLDALDQIHIPICVASSSFPDKLRSGLKVVGLYERFAPNIFSANSVAQGKPEPDVFIYAAGWMHTEPRRCLVIEDSIPGVTAAARAGMRVFGFDGGSHAKPENRDRLLNAGAELVFDKMSSLPALLASPEQTLASQIADVFLPVPQTR